uniref:Uncharacterized protein n=1 Tax=Nelumbo nucifera TaxID=4432 RepID=A0A822XMA9_NELNU|nr:TPA_asm: hypothetical protein HUJ06_021672 [Nelumbo nucifera]
MDEAHSDCISSSNSELAHLRASFTIWNLSCGCPDFKFSTPTMVTTNIYITGQVQMQIWCLMMNMLRLHVQFSLQNLRQLTPLKPPAQSLEFLKAHIGPPK